MPSLLCRKKGLARWVVSYHIEGENNILLLQQETAAPVDMVRMGDKHILVHASGPTWTQALPEAGLLPGMLGLLQCQHAGVFGCTCGLCCEYLFCRRILKLLGLFFLLPALSGQVTDIPLLGRVPAAASG